MADYDYDLFVIGAGSGGVRAARIAATHGARVAIAEEYRYGGTCVIRGCVPKKLLVYASQYSEHFEDAKGFGWHVGETSFDWKKLIASKDQEIARLEGIYRRNLKRSGVELHDTRAEIVGPHEVRLKAVNRTVSAKYILVATGGRPYLDDTVEGVEHTITSNEALHLSEFPKRIAIAGGGYIAVEFAGIFAGLGAETTLVYRGEEILRGFDDDLRSAVHNEMEKKGIRVLCGEVFTKIERQSDGTLKGHLRQGAAIEADQIMFAIGRRPNTDGLGLETAGVELGGKGEIKVDENSCTNVPSIYAIGDVTDRVNLTPVAIREGHAFADTVFGKNPRTVDHSLIPTAVFSQPEIGTVGLTEREACAAYANVDVYRSIFRPMRHTLSGRDEKMVMKILVDADTDRVLGVHVLGPDAGELSQVLGIALKMGATKADFDATMAVHPTAAEELVTMREPAEQHRRAAAE
ncbi:NADPH-glutathione reductase [Breoghania corrubedonensis]|uniref:Glutathione reductase n=1 Tax=Breoghania corrubedonensis TaxID=665038 RepID=A0A2T5VAY5_9HYPH|nr:glutathione-disulfide reductase [Breoghania corrubedonensis]PTW60913.1 NADPH-glutathione reductase [Breoghania corrubedonensis]